MNLTDAQALARDLMAQHGLDAKGWRFEFDNARRRLGHCRYMDSTISISRFMAAAATVDQVEQTMLHEIAHALLGPTRADGTRIGHGREWKRLAAQLGYRGARTSENPYQYRRGVAGSTMVAAANQPPSTAAFAPLFQPLTVQPARSAFHPGQQIRINHPQYANAGLFTVVKVGRTRVHVRTSRGTLTVPFSMAQPA